MPSVCALRGKLVLMVVAACAICLVPPAFARDTPRFDPIQCPNLPTQLGFPRLANARCGISLCQKIAVNRPAVPSSCLCNHPRSIGQVSARSDCLPGVRPWWHRDC